MLENNPFAQHLRGNLPLLDECLLMLTERRMAHALIIEGDDGLGKSTLARLIAQGAVCTCDTPLKGKCVHCIKASRAVHPDITVAVPSGKGGVLTVGDIRLVRENAYIDANEASRRVFILEDCDSMLPAAQNALLKVFEEPPAGAMFILTCRTRLALLETIRSRARVLTMLPVSQEDTCEVIAQKRPDASAEKIAQAAARSGGNIGVALGLLEDDKEEYVAARMIAHYVCARNEQDLLSATAQMKHDSAFWRAMLHELRTIIRQAVLISTGSESILFDKCDEADELSRLCSVDRLMILLAETEVLEQALTLNVDPYSLFPAALCARLRTAAGR